MPRHLPRRFKSHPEVTAIDAVLGACVCEICRFDGNFAQIQLQFFFPQRRSGLDGLHHDFFNKLKLLIISNKRARRQSAFRRCLNFATDPIRGTHIGKNSVNRIPTQRPNQQAGRVRTDHFAQQQASHRFLDASAWGACTSCLKTCAWRSYSSGAFEFDI